jgi:hypothetical protein
LSTSISPFKHQLITLLGIPAHLTGTGDVSLPLAYQKYRAFLIAFQTYEDMVMAKTWTIERPTKANIIELFVSKSFFHSHYKRYFPKVAQYGDMVAWLNEDEGRMCGIDLWGVKKDAYTFTDLAIWLQNGGTLEIESDYVEDDKKSKRTKGKEKRKEKVKVQDRRKEKSKEREHEMEKGKKKESHKKKQNGSQKSK